VPHGVQQVAPGLRILRSHHIAHRTFSHNAPATQARAGPDVDDVVGTADGVFVVLHHHKGVALVA
jgi:hypothetical protein